MRKVRTQPPVGRHGINIPLPFRWTLTLTRGGQVFLSRIEDGSVNFKPLYHHAKRKAARDGRLGD